METFSLRDVPKEALYVGLAGVIPYLATSLSTVYLSWDIQHAAHTGAGFLLSGETAEELLHIIEPIQLGYGATVSLLKAFKLGHGFAALTQTDNLVPWCYPLGLGMGRFWWLPGLPAICHRNSCYGCCVADTPPVC